MTHAVANRGVPHGFVRELRPRLFHGGRPWAVNGPGMYRAIL